MGLGKEPEIVTAFIYIINNPHSYFFYFSDSELFHMLSVKAAEELRISAHSGYTRGGIERFLCVSIINTESTTLIRHVNHTW